MAGTSNLAGRRAWLRRFPALFPKTARTKAGPYLTQHFAYCTAMVTVLLVAPPAEMTSGTAVPGVTSWGTSALICHKPTQPGAMPLNSTRALLPPIVTVGWTLVRMNGLPLAALYADLTRCQHLCLAVLLAALALLVFGSYLTARNAGRSLPAAADAVAIARSDRVVAEPAPLHHRATG